MPVVGSINSLDAWPQAWNGCRDPWWSIETDREIYPNLPKPSCLEPMWHDVVWASVAAQSLYTLVLTKGIRALYPLSRQAYVS
eukprot:COSAG02_NODE_10123_length_2016_cov_2.080334_1_plen_83_part_00